MPKYYTGNITPEEGTIFVFGSNPEGRHGAGSARVAVQQFGAIYGRGEGLQGNSYALPTTELRFMYQNFSNDTALDVTHYSRQSRPVKSIIESIQLLYQCCKEHPDKKFKVAYRNQPDEVTLCGYAGRDLMWMFKAAGEYPDNLYFSEEWYNSGLL